MSEDLNKYKKDLEAGLKVPEAYFAEKKKLLLAIPDNEIKVEVDKKPKVIRLWPKVLTWSLSAAAVISIAFFLLKPSDTNVDPFVRLEAHLNEMDKEQIEDYLMNEYIYGGDESLLLSEVEFEDLN